jgi:predicted phosphoribosyltransferase
MSLPIAYERAVAALGSNANQFHCISANVTTQFSSGGEWYFTFYSTNSSRAPKSIAIEFNGKVVFDGGLR